MTVFRAKYIEGLENRLGRMESLLRLSGTPLMSCWRPAASAGCSGPVY